MRFISNHMHHLDRLLPASAEALYQHLIHEFQTVAIELMRTSHKSWLDPMLRSDHAPTLVEMESVQVFPSETFDEVIEFLRLHVTSALGISGRRGAGKSTLLRWLTHSLEPDWITVYLPAPATYNALDFARTIFRTTASAVLARGQWKTTPVTSKILNVVIGRLRPRPASDEIMRISDEVLSFITGSRADQWTTTGGFSARGASMQRQKQTTVTQRERSHPELIATFAQYLEAYRRLGGQPIVIAIDELDKLATAEDAIGVVNSLKDLFHLPNTHFVVSVSEDALVRFIMRGIPFRDVFDSAFDDIIQIVPPSPEDAWKILMHRTGDFPISVALFCYAWSGGIPRDLIRTARACVDIRRRAAKPMTVRELVPPVIRHDVKDALDAALTAALGGDGVLDVEPLLVLRRRIEDETIPLEGALVGADLRCKPAVNGDDNNTAPMLERLALYIDLGSTIVRYFTSDFDEAVKARFDVVADVVHRLARAKFALATYPTESEWLLSEALRLMATNDI
jgi:Cdc6-like AAA superfamily ATPase